MAEKKNPKTATIFVCVSAAALMILTASAPFWATDVAGTRKALEERGLKPVAVGRYDSLACLLDLYATRFAAENSEGKIVKGVACSTPGINGVSIKFDR